MKIPMPCAFGESADCKGKMLPFYGISWFPWSSGVEYTYFFLTSQKWHACDFYCSPFKERPKTLTIPDHLLRDGSIREKRFPLKGHGYVNGIYYRDGRTYLDFILTDMFYSYIKVECDEDFKYVPDGNIIFPPSWDTEEKRNRVILKTFKP